jgi:hypothetical protein
VLLEYFVEGLMKRLLKQDHIAPGKKKKLEAKWTGPYYIVSKLNHDTCVIRNCETHKEHLLSSFCLD